MKMLRLYLKSLELHCLIFLHSMQLKTTGASTRKGCNFAYYEVCSWSLMNISKFSTFYSLLLVLISFTSCSQVVFKDLIQNSSTKSGVGGDIYGGKVFVHRMENDDCADGTNIKTMVIKDLDGEYSLTKNNCRPLNPSLPINNDEITLIDSKTIIYNNETLVEEFSASFESTAPKTVRDGELYCQTSIDDIDSGVSTFVRAEVYGDSTSKKYFAKVAWQIKDAAATNFYYADKLELSISRDTTEFLDISGDLLQASGENLIIISSVSRKQDSTGITSYLKLNTDTGKNLKLDLSCIGK